jgi:hypothetical protein
VRVWPVSKVPPPVLGYNNNVRHRGRIFHIQTEDSGVKFSRVVTHLFADGGRIIKTTKTDYTEHSAKPDVSAIVRGIMKEQHRAMFTALRGGGLDALLERAIGPLSDVPAKRASRPPAPPARQSVRPKPARESTPPPPPTRRRSLSNPALQGVTQAVVPPAAEEFELDVATLEALPPPRSQPPPAAHPRKSAVPPPRRSRPPQARPVPQPQRPPAQFASAPEARARSIFGDEAISEQTLDEVILSYLAEDLDGSQE